MAIPEFTKRLVEQKLGKFCANRVPPHARAQVRICFKTRGNNVTLCEERPAYDNPTRWVSIPVAQFRFDLHAEQWSLFYADRKSRWHLYVDLEPHKNLEILIREVDKDPTRSFWG